MTYKGFVVDWGIDGVEVSLLRSGTVQQVVFPSATLPSRTMDNGRFSRGVTGTLCGLVALWPSTSKYVCPIPLGARCPPSSYQP